MIFEDIANVMNARPVKEIMRKTGLTKNRVYSLRMGCTFHMDYELLFALQRMGYEVRVFAVGDPARRSRDGDGKMPVRGDEVMAAKRTTAQGGFAQRNGAEWRQAPGCERGATFERSENGVASTLPPAGATTGQPGFAAGEMRPNGSKGRGGNGSRVWEKRKASAFAGPITKSADGVTFLMWRFTMQVQHLK